jgi:flavin reductase (DIM6/NTAB) family NADH-FMN oxidoreductase RutF
LSAGKTPDGAISPKEFWTIVGNRATAATVVTATGGEGPAGFLALSATHLSASPATMMVSIHLRTSALETIRTAGHFAINLLGEHDRAIADLFGGRNGPKGAARFEVGEWSLLATGAPVLASACGAIDCELDELIERHGTIIAIGRIAGSRINAGIKPLVYFSGDYVSLP